MFFRILKKDLKRKKTMNCILLLFVILCSMFASASINDLIAVTGGVEHFMEISDTPDVKLDIPADQDIEDKIRALPCVQSIKTEKTFYLTADHFKFKGEKIKDLINASAITHDKEMCATYFDADNNVVTEVPKGSFYCTKNFFQSMEYKKGDILEVAYGEKKMSLRFEGILKTAVHDTNNSSSPHIMLNDADWKTIDSGLEDNALLEENVLFIKTSDVDAVIEASGDAEGVAVYTGNDIKNYFLYDMLTAYIMMALSIILVIAAFVTLRFAIGFTISEEFREIGVMKAVGVGNASIRSLYITKYAAIAIVGSAIGYAGSVPLGDYLLASVSQNIVFSGSSTLTGLAGSLAVIVLILLFCYGCTRRINKLSPIDAVRSGQTGERFGKKSIMHLGRSKLPATGFLALNDVISAPRQFVIITIVFTLCVLMMTIMSNCSNTLSSDKPITFFAIPVETDVSLWDADIDVLKNDMGEAMTKPDGWKVLVSDTEKLLEDNGMPGKCTVTMGYMSNVVHGDKNESIMLQVTRNISADVFKYDEGSAPMKTDEIALTSAVMEKLGAEIGDSITIDQNGTEKELIITGSFSTFINNGMSARLSEDAELNMDKINNFMGVQVEFDDDPDDAEIERNVKKLKEITGGEKIYSNAQMVDTMTEMSGTLNSIKKMMMLMTVIVTSLIVILMERSFISKEKNEIALMKAVGLKNGSVIGQHMLRFIIAALIAAAAASAVVLPISKALMTFIFSMIGSVRSAEIAFDAVEIFAVCPLILLGVTVIGTFLTALYTGTIKPSDTASIE